MPFKLRALGKVSSIFLADIVRVCLLLLRARTIKGNLRLNGCVIIEPIFIEELKCVIIFMRDTCKSMDPYVERKKYWIGKPE